MTSAELAPIVRRALDEDLDTAGDVTSDAVIPEATRARARVVARSTLVLSGLPALAEVYRQVDPAVEIEASHADGQRVEAGCCVARLAGAARSVLRGERTALNFLMRMSGIATAAARAVEEIAGTTARILDTRKTAPGLRRVDKYAVRCGGAVNHRMGLFDAVMIKDTHLDAGCTIADAVQRARARGHAPAAITVEVRNLAQLSQAIDAGAGRALLDNMDLATMRAAVRAAAGRLVLEASGGLRPGNLRSVAETGVDFLSLGCLTHSAAAADLALETETWR